LIPLQADALILTNYRIKVTNYFSVHYQNLKIR